MEPGVLGFGIRNPAYDWIQNQVPLTDWNPVAGIRNPWSGIQNRKLFWILSISFPEAAIFCTATGIANWTKVTEALGTRLGFPTLGARDFPCVVSGFVQDFIPTCDASRRTRFPYMAPNMLYVCKFAYYLPLRPVHTYTDIFESTNFSFGIQKFPVHSYPDSLLYPGLLWEYRQQSMRRGCQAWHVN